jgi:cyclic beta-1,2-glucan synthetase
MWRTQAAALLGSLEREAWDGDWYRRGWYDDGTPLGSAASKVCRIDSTAQTWAVISGAADSERTARAMAAVERELIRPQDGLALLFTPPFDQTRLDPLHGVIRQAFGRTEANIRNAAVWSVMAFAGLGQGDKAGGCSRSSTP